MPVTENSPFSETLPELCLPESCNYIAVFLTLDCNLACSYCINRFFDLAVERRLLSGNEWVRGLNRIIPRPDLPVTLQGGEPTLHPDFFAIVNGIRPDLNIDLLTNLEFDAQQFMHQIDPERLRRDAPYASIRVSYHPETMDIASLAAKVLSFLHNGYSIGIWGVLHPDFDNDILAAQDYCRSLGIDFRTKEFLGEYAGTMQGRYSYPGACERITGKSVQCRTSELIIGPDGGIYRCHSDLYAGRSTVGNILDRELEFTAGFRSCDCYGYCNPCDVKLKTDRFQEFGHTSVEIRFVD